MGRVGEAQRPIAVTVSLFWRTVRTPARDRDPEAIREALPALEAKLGIAEARLRKRPFLAGADITLADIQFGQVLHRYFGLPLERADLPALARYHARLTERPAYREHVMVSDDELRAD